MYATDKNHIEIVNLLIDKSVDMNIQDNVSTLIDRYVASSE